MVEYYDSKRKALIKITKTNKKPSTAKKKQYRNQKLNQLGALQRDALNQMIFVRSMATKDPQFAPLDMQNRIISAQKEQLELQKQIAGLTLAIQSLNKNDEKEYSKVLTKDVSTSTDYIPPAITVGDILMADRDVIGSPVFDKLLITQTRQERLKALGKQFPQFNIFKNDRLSQEAIDNLYNRLNEARLPVPQRQIITKTGEDKNPIANIYKFFSEGSGVDMLGGQAPYMRTTYDLPQKPLLQQMERGVEQSYTPLGEASGTDVYEEFQSAKEEMSETEIPVGEPSMPMAPVIQTFGDPTATQEYYGEMPPPLPRSPRRTGKGKQRQK